MAFKNKSMTIGAAIFCLGTLVPAVTGAYAISPMEIYRQARQQNEVFLQKLSRYRNAFDMQDKDGNTEELTCDGEHEFTKPLAVLVNQYSASASEIFSGAVQDYGIGQIVGVTTYGKGVVQQLTDLGDGTCLKLTIAEYYTPNGRSINGVGVEPDVEVEYKYNENDPEADNQLERALEVVREQIG